MLVEIDFNCFGRKCTQIILEQKYHKIFYLGIVKMSNLDNLTTKNLPAWVSQKYYEDYLCFLIEEFKTQQNHKQFHFLIKDILEEIIMSLNTKNRPNFHTVVLYVIQNIFKALNIQTSKTVFNDADLAGVDLQFVNKLILQILKKKQQNDAKCKNIRSQFSIIYGKKVNLSKISNLICSLTEFTSICASSFMMENWKIEFLCFCWILQKKYNIKIEEQMHQNANRIENKQKLQIYKKIQQIFASDYSRQ